MPEQESGYVPEKEYDSAVEKIMETSGPDIGRVKDEEVAFDAAVAEDSRRSERRPSQVQDGPESDEMNERQATSTGSQSISNAIYREARDTSGNNMSSKSGRYYARQAGERAVRSYDQFKNDARIAKAREKVDEAEEAA